MGIDNYCIDCNREIPHVGRCAPCAKKAKKRRLENADKLKESQYIDRNGRTKVKVFMFKGLPERVENAFTGEEIHFETEEQE